MKNILIALAFAFAVSLVAEAQHPEAKKVTHIAVMSVLVVDPDQSNASNCTSLGCATVYRSGEAYIPFTSLEDALAYLNGSRKNLICLYSVKEQPVISQVVRTPVHHPDTESLTLHYSIPTPNTSRTPKGK